MKKSSLYIGKLFMISILCIAFSTVAVAQEPTSNGLRTKLESLLVDAPGLSEKVDSNINNFPLADFLRGLGTAHKLNFNIDPALNDLIIAHNFSNVQVVDVLVFVCEEFDLELNLTGTIISIKKRIPPPVVYSPRIIPISYNPSINSLSLELSKDTLSVVFKRITEATGKNLVFKPGMEHIPLSGYVRNMTFDKAMEHIAFSNDLSVVKTNEDYFMFEGLEAAANNRMNKSKRRFVPAGGANFYYEVLDTIAQRIAVDFKNIKIEEIIENIAFDLDIDLFTTETLKDIGVATVKAQSISFEQLLDKMLLDSNYSYSIVNNMYFFGKKTDGNLKNAVIVPLLHRSVEIMKNQGSRQTNFTASMYTPNMNYSSRNYGMNQRQNGLIQQPQTSRSTSSTSSDEGEIKTLLELVPDSLKTNLDIKTDLELNSFIVNGNARKIERFQKFINYIDKPIPVITIEVMIMEVNKTANLETGIDWGIGEEKSKTLGTTFPATDMTIGSDQINKVIQGGNGLGTLNLGRVLPEFYMNIKALENNGDIKVRSTPKLSTLNGHRSNLSIGETSYYVVTQNNYYGSQISQASEIKNYYPIKAELAINLKPLVAGDGQITMDINVIQSNFNGERIEEEAPPGMNTREFTSIVRVRDQELIVLGGLEEKMKNDTGTGVPVLARVPVLKWFFSKRKRQDSKKMLVLFIKPTVIY